MKPSTRKPAVSASSVLKAECKPLRLVGVLRRMLGEPGGNKHALTQAINQANEQAGFKCHITYEKFSKLVDEDGSVGLTVDELNALNTYLGLFGEGLDEKPIFDKAGILSRLVECGQLTVFFGAYPNPASQRNDVSLWDNRAMAVLLKEVGNLDRRVHINTQEVLWSHGHSMLREQVQSTVEHLDREGSSLISIGTPRACMATEILLSQALGVAPRRRGMLPELTAVPFHFAWPQKLVSPMESSFVLSGDDLIGLGFTEVGGLVKQGDCSAIRIGNEVFETYLRGSRTEWTMYGVILAQRRARGNVWLVVSGISGPATYACASQVSKMRDVLPFVEHSDGSVLWAVVRTQVKLDESGRQFGDRRVVGPYELFRGPYVWPAP